ncbi:MAG: isoamylase early set domain-containing protein [Nitrospirota bacterium]
MNGKEKEKKVEKKVKKPAKKPKKESQKEQKIEIKLYAPEAENVSVAGEFNDWDIKALPMKKSKDGMWKVKIKLFSGRYEYRFFVDGAWAEDIPDVEVVPNPFGTFNLVINVE